MDYLRTLGSAAVSTLVQKSGLNLPFSLGAKVSQHEGYYNLYDATKRDDGSPVSVFEYDFTDTSKKNAKSFAQNALKKLRTTRHPDILKFMDAVESESSIYIMTERVRPLSDAISQYSGRSQQEKEDWLLWGIHRVSVALSFINDQAMSTHGKLITDSIFISPSGEWKLGGFELFSSSRDESPILYTLGSTYPGSIKWAPPEVKKTGWLTLKDCDPAAADAYALGLLLHAVFNPSHPPPPTAEPPHPPPAANSRGSIPTAVFPVFKKLMNPNPKSRLYAKGFLEVGMAEQGFFSNNRLVKVCSGLDNFSLASDSEKSTLLRTLKDSASSFPPEFATHKVLPSLVSALEFGGASAASIIPLLLTFGSHTPPEEYSKIILTPIFKLYTNPDRGIRMALLEHLPDYVEKLDKKAVSEKIFPHLQLGFSDTVPLIREATLKSISLLAPKLTDRLLNNDLLRLLAKTQMDTEPSIRTNTCILIGRLGPTLGYNTKRKVLVPALSRALKDTFVHARVAGLMAFIATLECYEISELATKVIPSISFTMMDEEKIVRDQAFKAMELFMKKLQDHAATMVGLLMILSTLGAVPVPSTLVTTAAGAAGSLAGWAFSTLGKRMAASDLETPMATTTGPEVDRSNSAPPTSLSNHIGEIKRPTFANNLSSSSLPASRSTGKGLQLNSSKQNTSVAAGILADEILEDVAGSATLEGNPWGNDDLIDVNADEGDWSAFETAPVNSPSPNIPQTPFATASFGGTSVSKVNHTPRTASPSNIARARSPLSPSGPTSRPKSPPVVQDSWDSGAEWGSTEAPPTQISSPATTGHAPSTLTKEDKALEMARRKEERKQRIAMLKEQKKSATQKPS
ncbi:hypothetical protein CVT24_004129 [Panaeolus cyanescens]|uniref:Protein kinase domain-containing protein n=1 Tax=Panaeolus cyanescens TaxID=181874 RepID=A0A409Y612_9AGAR|nr:hypothetical protein CVT24_004129 [Panaeolus cyanescens]